MLKSLAEIDQACAELQAALGGMSGNLSLWNLVEKTDPAHTKPITGKPYKGTSPKPYFLIHEATKTFGPCGQGWGFKILSERVEDGSAGDKVHIAHIQVWYEWNGRRGEVEHIGETIFAGKNKNGPFTDEDAPKKSVTDALVKALSMIGFAGDIFIGRYDDSKYVQEIAEEFREIPVAPAPPVQIVGSNPLPVKSEFVMKPLPNWTHIQLEFSAAPNETELARKHQVAKERYRLSKVDEEELNKLSAKAYERFAQPAEDDKWAKGRE